MPALHVSTSPAVTAAVLPLYDCRSPRSGRSPVSTNLNHVASTLSRLAPPPPTPSSAHPSSDAASPASRSSVSVPPNTPFSAASSGLSFAGMHQRRLSYKTPMTPVTTPVTGHQVLSGPSPSIASFFSGSSHSGRRSGHWSPRFAFAKEALHQQQQVDELDLLHALEALMTPTSAEGSTSGRGVQHQSTPMNTPVSAYANKWIAHDTSILEAARRLQYVQSPPAILSLTSPRNSFSGGACGSSSSSTSNSTNGRRRRSPSSPVSMHSGRVLYDIAEHNREDSSILVGYRVPPSSPMHGAIAVTTVFPAALTEALTRLQDGGDGSRMMTIETIDARPATRRLSPRADYSMPMNTPVSSIASAQLRDLLHDDFLRRDSDVQSEDSDAMIEDAEGSKERLRLEAMAEEIRLGLEKAMQQK